MNIIIFGPQGCGKGTQADMIEKKYKLKHVVMGEYLRAEIKKKTAFGKKIEPLLKQGKLVDDKTINDLLLKITKKYKSIILDGYPRTIAQADYLDNVMKINKAIYLKVRNKEVIKRISARRVCPKCNKNYNLIFIKPKKEGLCDDCKVKLIQRFDDKPKAIKERLQQYHELTEPLIAYYRKKGLLRTINGEPSINVVFKSIQKAIGSGK